MTAQEKWELLSSKIIEASNDSQDFTEWERQDYESLCKELLEIVNQ